MYASRSTRFLTMTLVSCGLGLSVIGSGGAVAKQHQSSVGLRSARSGTGSRAAGGGQPRRLVGVMLGPRVTDLFHSVSVTASGITAHEVEVRLIGATDEAGLAYEWAPYRWQRLRLRQGTWRGVLPAPALLGVYQVQLRLDHGRKLLSSADWLLRVFPRGTMPRRSFPSAVAAVRNFVTNLPGDQVLVALRRWPQAAFDHRDPRLHRLFVLAYAPRADSQSSLRLGLFVTTVRDGFRGHWRVLQATVEPYD
jgi:hypothetical protein